MAEEQHPSPSPSQPSAAAQPGVASPAGEVWKILGRDTPGGKALYNLYGGNSTGKTVGQQHHQRNKQQHDKKLAAGWAPKPIEAPKPEALPRPQVNYPKFGNMRPDSADVGAARVRQIPRRRPAEVIQKELQEAEELRRAAPPPLPRGSLLDEAEKARLAEMMRYRGKVPQPSTQELEEAVQHRGGRPGRPRSERDELQLMFDMVSQEVDERRQFLADMERAGALKRDHVHQIHAEIKLRVADMQRIDRLLQQAKD